jgi:6-pyruvoyltetrahydropterin/6-carboxytetrahydropterin synthase
MIYVSRLEHFNAAHKLYNPNWSLSKNKEVFGPCANVNWHGHNYELVTTVKGKPDPDTGFVIDLKQLSLLIKKHIIDQVDHKNLNMDVSFMEGRLASTENLVVEFWRILEPHIASISDGRAKLHCLKLYETPRNYVEYFGEE